LTNVGNERTVKLGATGPLMETGRMLSIVATELRKTILADATAMNPIRVLVAEAVDIVSLKRDRAQLKQFVIATFVMLVLFVAGIGLAFMTAID
jgi:hypothetical protein